MSALLDEAIRVCKAEELRLNERIHQYKDILRCMNVRVKDSREAQVSVSLKDDDISMEDRQNIELLEQVLRKALKVRSSSLVSSSQSTGCQGKPQSNDNATKAPINDTAQVPYKRKPQTSPSSSKVKGSHQRGATSNCVSGNRNLRSELGVKRVPSAQSTMNCKRLTMKVQPAQTNAGVDLQKKPWQTVVCPKKSGGEKMNFGLPVKEGTCPSEQELKAESEASCSKQQWVPSPLLPLWRKERSEKNWLWNKVLVSDSKPVPEREQFKKRLIRTFPTEWPSGHLAAMEAELDVLTKLGHVLIHCYNAALRNHQPSSNPDMLEEREYDSQLMMANLEKKISEVIKHAKHLKKDWEKKLAWSHESLCPLQSRSEWHDPELPCVPLLLVYSSKSELEELYDLRLHIDLLQLEFCLHQTMCDALMELIPCKSLTECPSAAVLRGVYSVLGGGGAHFPSLIVDT